MSLALLRFLASHVFVRRGYRLDFVRMGLGIEHRAKRFSAMWAPHFESSKRAQTEWWTEKPERGTMRRLAVLGAGRLLDFSESSLRGCSHVDLLDADPLCRSAWSALKRKHPSIKFSFYTSELSGCLASWDRQFSKESRGMDWDSALKILARLEPPERSPLRDYLDEHSPTHILSLNILSQIPVMWQDKLERGLIKRFGKLKVEACEDEWIAAFAPTARKLLRAHLSDLAACSRASMLLLSDVEYLYYPASVNPGEIIRDNPFNWCESDDGGEWKLQPALEKLLDESWKDGCFRMDALYEINVENPKMLSVMFPQHVPALRSSWLWHICPEPENNQTEAVIHRVRAIELATRSDALTGETAT